MGKSAQSPMNTRPLRSHRQRYRSCHEVPSGIHRPRICSRSDVFWWMTLSVLSGCQVLRGPTAEDREAMSPLFGASRQERDRKIEGLIAEGRRWPPRPSVASIHFGMTYEEVSSLIGAAGGMRQENTGTPEIDFIYSSSGDDWWFRFTQLHPKKGEERLELLEVSRGAFVEEDAGFLRPARKRLVLKAVQLGPVVPFALHLGQDKSIGYECVQKENRYERITKVLEKSAAQRAKLQVGDRIVSVDGLPTVHNSNQSRSSEAIHLILSGKAERAVFEIQRGEKIIYFVVQK